jgi:LacI family transcriptional regulator
MEKMGFVPRPPEVRPGPRVKNETGIKTGQLILLYSYINEVAANSSPSTMLLSRGVQSSLAESGMNMLVGFVDNHTSMPPSLGNGAVDGIILVGNDPPRSLDKVLRKHTIVGVFSNLQQFWGDCVHIDNEAVCQMAVEYLLSRGHRHIALLDAYPRRRINTIRAELFSREASRAGLTVQIILSDLEAVDSSGHSTDFVFDTKNLVNRLFEFSPVPTGLFIPGDMFISSLYPELVARKDRFSGDFDIVTLNQHRSSLSGLDPCPMVIDCKPEYIGKRAVQQLFWRLQHLDDPQQTILIRPGPITMQNTT